MKKISFCILNQDCSVKFLEDCWANIQTLKIPEYEILIYDPEYSNDQVRNIYEKEQAKPVSRGYIKNMLCENSINDLIVFLDARIQLTSNWYENIKSSNYFDLTGCRIIDSEGRRVPDWSCIATIGSRNIVLPLDYDEWTKRGFVNSSLMIFRKSIWERIHFEENLEDDLKMDSHFCQQAVEAGYRIGVAADMVGRLIEGPLYGPSMSSSTYSESEKIYNEFNSYSKQGNEAFKLNDNLRAEENFQKILEIFGDEENALEKMGWIYYFKAEYLKANARFLNVTKRNPKCHSALRGLGWSFFQQGEYPNTIKYLKTALRFIPANDHGAQWEARRGLGWANYHIGEASVAIENFNEILNDDHGDIPGLMQDVYRGLAWSNSKLGNKILAKEYFNKALKYIDAKNNKELLADINNGLNLVLKDDNLSPAVPKVELRPIISPLPSKRPLWRKIGSRIKRMLKF